jgi:hypothetical protein
MAREGHAEQRQTRRSRVGELIRQMMLIVRDRGEGWVWQGYLTPEIRIVQDDPGETKPVTVEVYTADKIKVTIKVTLDTLPNQDSQLTATIDRNTGAAEFQFSGPEQTTTAGSIDGR